MSDTDVSRRDAHMLKEREYWTSKVAEYEDKLRDARTKRDDAIAALAPFKVGQGVEVSIRGKWEPAIVRMIEPHTWGCYFKVSLRKKNGEWATQTQRIYGDQQIRVPERST